MPINFTDMSNRIFEILQREIDDERMRTHARNVSIYLNYGNSFDRGAGYIITAPLRIRSMLKSVIVDNGMDLPEDYLQAWDIGSSDVDEYTYTPWSVFLSDKKNYEKYNINPHGPTISTDGEKIFLLSEENEDRPTFRYYAKLNDLNFDDVPDYPHNWVDKNRPDLYLEGIIAQIAQEYDDESRRVEAISMFKGVIDLLNKNENSVNFSNAIKTTRRFFPPGG